MSPGRRRHPSSGLRAAGSRRWRLVACAAVALAAVGGARGADETVDSTDARALTPVEVTGVKGAARVSYERLLEGVATFARHRPRAPTAELLFQVFDRAVQPAPPLVVRLDVEDRSFVLAPGDDGRFRLPGRDMTGPGDGELVANRRLGEILIEPSVRSAGTTSHERRLGDLRAECEVWWTVYRDDTPFLLRNAVELLGGICRSATISVDRPSASRLAAATLSSGSRTARLKLEPDGLGYVPPLHDKEWSDDARVLLTDR